MAAVSYAGTAFGYSPFRPSGTREGSTFGMVGMTGSAAYADIDSGVVVALMRIDQIVAGALG